MKNIDGCAVQKFAGKTSEVASLPTVATIMEDGTQFFAADGSTFLDLDTGTVYMFLEGKWYKL